jgi:WhiB family transcriptional regulator, redox-sensing transcriptional regulator
MSWYRNAACQGEDPELFFPISTTGPARLQLMEAKRVCARCPVLSECLRWAIVTGMEHGVWGGMSEGERRALRRRIARRRLLKPQTTEVDAAGAAQLG